MRVPAFYPPHTSHLVPIIRLLPKLVTPHVQHLTATSLYPRSLGTFDPCLRRIPLLVLSSTNSPLHPINPSPDDLTASRSPAPESSDAQSVLTSAAPPCQSFEDFATSTPDLKQTRLIVIHVAGRCFTFWTQGDTQHALSDASQHCQHPSSQSYRCLLCAQRCARHLNPTNHCSHHTPLFRQLHARRLAETSEQAHK